MYLQISEADQQESTKIKERLREAFGKDGFTAYTMFQHKKWEMVENAREVCGSIRVRGKNPDTMWYNNEVKVVSTRKEDAWKEVLAANHAEAKDRCIEAYRKKKRKVKRYIYQSKKKSK